MLLLGTALAMQAPAVAHAHAVEYELGLISRVA